MVRSVHDSFKLFDLESDLFGESTTHEVHNEHTLSDRKQQLIDPWDPGVWAPKDEDETKHHPREKKSSLDWLVGTLNSSPEKEVPTIKVFFCQFWPPKFLYSLPEK